MCVQPYKSCVKGVFTQIVQPCSPGTLHKIPSSCRGMDKGKYRDLADLTDSEEEVHPNIDTKSYRRFIKAERRRRLDELRSKNGLSEKEAKELKKLEYKHLPVAVEIPENSFRTSKEDPDADCAQDLANILSHSSIQSFVEYLDSRLVNLESLEELVYFNLSEAIKEGNEEFGLELCRVGLMVRWTREFGRAYLLRLVGNEGKLDEIVKSHYRTSKEAILSLRD